MILINNIALSTLALYIIPFTLLFLIYIEVYVGSIMFRYNSENKLYFNLWSGLNFLMHPLYDKFLWNVNSLHMNYPFMIVIFIAINLILRYHNFDKQNGFLERSSSNSTNLNLRETI
jgi:hypothetical protein